MRFAEEYPWSTHQEYFGKRNSIVIDRGLLGEFFPEPMKYKEFARDILQSRKYKTVSHLTLD
ncbi:hypothetical protein HQ584_08645 [Patescibacteria group bacterium]|nr:hypothetical protein [Patescibacteria group bacterium]